MTADWVKSATAAKSKKVTESCAPALICVVRFPAKSSPKNGLSEFRSGTVGVRGGLRNKSIVSFSQPVSTREQQVIFQREHSQCTRVRASARVVRKTMESCASSRK